MDIKGIKIQISKWEEEVKSLKKKAEGATGSAKEKLEAKIKEIQSKIGDAKDKLQNLKSKGEDIADKGKGILGKFKK